MSTGRTVNRWTRVYVDGYDLSGYARSIGPLSVEFDAPDLTVLSDGVVGVLPNQAHITPGELNGVLDNTATSGIQAVLSTAGTYRKVMIPIGIRAAPAAGDPVFLGSFEQLSYKASDDGGAMVVNVPFGEYDITQVGNYTKPWGTLLHALSAATAANSDTGIDDRGSATTAGGYLMYQVTAGDGTATISVDDSADNSSFTALSGATSGVIDCSAATSGIVALGTTATVRRYLRWQIALGTASTVTFALAFVRI
jgi:hypothetical protein